MKFFESVKVSAIQPLVDESYDFERITVTQECGNSGDAEGDQECPWSTAAADCWESDSKSKKFVMKRRLVDHVEATTGANYYFRGAFTSYSADAEGRIVEQEVVGDAKPLELFTGETFTGTYNSAYKLAIVATAGLFAATSLII